MIFKLFLGLVILGSTESLFAIEQDDSSAQNAALLFDFAGSNKAVATERNGSGVVLNKHRTVEDEGTGVQSSRLIMDDPNSYVSNKSIGQTLQTCSASDGLTIETWVANDQTIDLVTKNDIIFRIDGLLTLYQHYDEGPRYKVDIGGRSIMTPANSLLAKDGSNLVPQKIVISISKKGFTRVYLSVPDSEMSSGYRMIPRANGSGMGNNVNYNTMTLSVGNNANPNYSVADSSDSNNSWRGSMYNLSVSCGYSDAAAVTGMVNFEKKVEAVAIDIFGEDDNFSRKAALIYNRIAGVKVPLDHPSIKMMASKLAQGDDLGAAAIATNADSFYNVTLRDFAAGLSNREESINVPLNDFSATLIGIVRDNRSAKLFLTGDEIYYGDKTKVPVDANIYKDLLMSNKHYEQLDSMNANLRNVLKPRKQELSNGRGSAIVNPEPAGLLTTRAFLSAHHVAGTGRRPVEFAFREFLCLPIDQLADSGDGNPLVMDNRIGRDIDRSPGGEPSKFDKNCKSCHVPMDGFRGAFAYFSWRDGYVNYGPVVDPGNEFDSNGVARKFNNNSNVYPKGFVTVDNNFKNYAIGKKNEAQIGWDKPGDGKGVREFAVQLSRTKAFPRCMAKRVYKAVCKREAVQFEDKFIERKAKEFSDNGYNMKNLFESIAISRECIGG